METLFEINLPFTIMKSQSEFYSFNSSKYYQRNQGLQQADFLSQQILMDLGEMCNVRFAVIQNMNYGCKLSVYVAEFKSGPYVPVKEEVYIPSHKMERKIKLGSLPCRYVRLIVHKGVHLKKSQISLVGSTCEKLAEDTNLNEFRLLVSNPQRILY